MSSSIHRRSSWAELRDTEDEYWVTIDGKEVARTSPETCFPEHLIAELHVGGIAFAVMRL